MCPICGASCRCKRRGQGGLCCSCHSHKARARLYDALRGDGAYRTDHDAARQSARELICAGKLEACNCIFRCELDHDDYRAAGFLVALATGRNDAN